MGLLHHPHAAAFHEKLDLAVFLVFRVVQVALLQVTWKWHPVDRSAIAVNGFSFKTRSRRGWRLE